MPDRNLYLTRGFGNSEVYLYCCPPPKKILTPAEMSNYLSQRTPTATLSPAIGHGIMAEDGNRRRRYGVLSPDGTTPDSMEAAAEIVQQRLAAETSGLEKMPIVDVRPASKAK